MNKTKSNKEKNQHKQLVNEEIVNNDADDYDDNGDNNNLCKLTNGFKWIKLAVGAVIHLEIHRIILFACSFFALSIAYLSFV